MQHASVFPQKTDAPGFGAVVAAGRIFRDMEFKNPVGILKVVRGHGGLGMVKKHAFWMQAVVVATVKFFAEDNTLREFK